MAKSPLFWKISTLIGCVLLLSVPLMLVRQLISERTDYRQEVIAALERSASGSQKLAGPLMVVPVTETLTRLEGKKEVQYQQQGLRYLLPESLSIKGKQDVESRQVGIYSGQIWHNDLQIAARFDVAKSGLLRQKNLTLGKPFLVVAVSDARGIGAMSGAPVNGETLSVEPGLGLSGSGEGIHIPLPALSAEQNTLDLAFTLNLSGTGSFSAAPLGRASELTLTSHWPHPGFLGDFLPASRTITPEGFSARWQSNWFANNMTRYFADNTEISWANLPSFNVNVTTPADQYQLTDRATKYAILLIVLTFMAFFIFESLTARRLHPLQYLLVGLSLVMFYLLLLALSEHLGFTVAWVIASLIGACMNGIYLQAVLKGWRNSLGFVGVLLLLDGVMWALLRSEDSALLLGSGVLLLALGAVMFLTRHIDWYALSRTRPAENAPGDNDELRLWK